MVLAAFSSTAIKELNGNPVALTPSPSLAASYPTAWHTNAKTNGFETLWIENAVRIAALDRRTPDADHGNAEQPRRRPRQRGDVVRDDTTVVGQVVLIRLGHRILHLLGIRKITRRHQRWRGRIVERKALVQGSVPHETAIGP